MSSLTGPEALSADRPIHLSEDVKPPEIITRVEPVYPPELKRLSLEATVIIEAVISKEGRVSSARILRSGGHDLFDKAALDAVKQWRYQPALLNDKPVDVYLTIAVAFKLK